MQTHPRTILAVSGRSSSSSLSKWWENDSLFWVVLPLYRVCQISFINHKFWKTVKVLYLEDALEFLAHIAPSCSTYEYFGSPKYEALTPSHHGDMKHQYFEGTPQCVLLRERFLKLGPYRPSKWKILQKNRTFFLKILF